MELALPPLRTLADTRAPGAAIAAAAPDGILPQKPTASPVHSRATPTSGPLSFNLGRRAAIAASPGPPPTPCAPCERLQHPNGAVLSVADRNRNLYLAREGRRLRCQGFYMMLGRGLSWLPTGPENGLGDQVPPTII